MASTTPNINTTATPMARFSISEDDEDAPLTFKRPRFNEPASQSQRSIHQSQSRLAAEQDVEEEEEDLIPLDDVESDSQGSEEEEEDDEDDEGEYEEEEVGDDVGSEDDGDYHGETEPVPDGQNQQQQTSSTAELLRGSPNVAVGQQSSTIASPVFNNASGALQVLLTDPDVLDCPICLDPLCTPVFQCENGHIACSSCCSKVKRKCPSCCMPIGYNRCRAIEKVIESVRVSCKNARYGCRKTMTYSKKSEHEQLCPYTTCFCPHLSCPFSGSSKNLYLHFGIQHSASTTRFTYNTTFFVNVTTNQKHIFLQEQHESVIFILNHEVKEHGRAFSVDCVGPSTLKLSFVYQLTAKNEGGILSLQCVPDIYSKWSEHTLKKNYLTVPSDFTGYNGVLPLHICIKKLSHLYDTTMSDTTMSGTPSVLFFL